MRQPIIDVFGQNRGAMGWATHSVGFSSALSEIAEVRFHSNEQPPTLELNSHSPADFGIVVIGSPIEPFRSSRWIFWETTILPQSQSDLCASTRYLWSPSTWGQKTLIENGIDSSRVAVVPGGVDTKFFVPGLPEVRRFRFLSVGKWENRKFTEGLIRAFADEFKNSEDVELYLQVHNPYITNFSVRAKIEQMKLPGNPNIIIGDPCSIADLKILYQSSNCFVLPTRAEGWGLPILEAMSCGVPAIVTNYSAPVDYIDDQNGFPLQVAKMVEAHDDDFGIHSGYWAEPDVAHLRYLMRNAYQNPDLLLEKGQCARRTAERFTWSNSARLALDFVQSHV